MLDGSVYSRPNYWFTLIKNDSDSGIGWIAFGSRQVSQVTVEAHGDYFKGALDTWDFDICSSYAPHCRTFEFHGTSSTLTYVKAVSPLAAIGALLDAFRDEEEREVEEERDRKRRVDLARFGGEIDEELARKIVKWRKKRDREQG